jgi:hypothetical protein
MHRNCHDHSLLWLVLLAVILSDGDKQPAQPSNQAVPGAGCAGALALLMVLVVRVLVVVGKTYPDPLPFASVTPAVYTQTEPTTDVAPRAILVEMPAPRAELIALPVRRATLVKLPKAGQVTASVRVY